MSVDSSQYSALFETLNLGSFPKNVLTFQDSTAYLYQLVFVDYKLQASLQPISPGTLFVASDDVQAKINQLINYVDSVNSNYSRTDKSYLEVYYSSVVLAHLQILSHDYEGAIQTLNGFRIDHSVPLATQAEREFLDYVSARFHSLLGKASRNGSAVWSIFLESLKSYGHASQVSANIWVSSIFKGLLSEISAKGKRPIDFTSFRGQSYAKNICSFVAIANYTLKPENEKFITSSFRTEYVNFISELLNEKIKQRKDFPNASEDNSDDLGLVQSFYQTLNDVSSHRPVITYFVKPKLSKKFLISMTEKSYQSQFVLSNLILSLIDLGEYDEALAAFKTYASYVEKEKVQTGNVPDLLEVVSLYSICISSFNPLNSFILDSKSSFKKFKYNNLDSVVHDLVQFAKDCQNYLGQVGEIAELSYDHNGRENVQDRLSFLYSRYNPNVLFENKSALVSILSEAWYSLGKLYQFLAIHNSPTPSILEENTDSVLTFHKNSLIVNSSGNLTYLLDYALVLANESHITESSKLCKFILKKFPESFKTWNLLALLASASENKKSLNSQEISSIQTDDTFNKSHGSSDFSNQNGKLATANEPEKFIEDALSIASIYITKHRDLNVSLPVQTKYEILQLKMTQLAVWEAKHGVESILEFITDVFILYRELFSHVQFPKSEAQSVLGSRIDIKWSRRPSLMDPSEKDGGRGSPSVKHLTKDKIKRLSKISIDNGDRKLNNERREEKEAKRDHKQEMKILQEIWLWTASIYLKLGFLEEAEQCIVEAETVDKPNVKTYTYLGFLTSKSRKHLALQEFERSFEILHSTEEKYNRKAYGLTLVGMCQLLITNDGKSDSLFVSEKDRDAGLVRLKNYLEGYSNCWSYGHNCPEIWYYLSAIYEEFDDKSLQSEALWKCVDLETVRPVRSYDTCEDFTLH